MTALPLAVDPTTLAAWAEGALPGSGPLTVEALGDGHSNLTFLIRREESSWVLRRPPLGPLLPTAHDVEREYRVLTLLRASRSAVRVPSVVALCTDLAVLGAPFYVMERAPGVVIREVLPPWLAADVAGQRALGLDLVDTLAEIHAVDPAPFVAAGLGRAGGYLERQLRRWTGQREGIQAAVAAEGGRARDLPDYDVVRDWLRANLPVEAAPAIVHGDFKLDNALVLEPGFAQGRGAAQLRGAALGAAPVEESGSGLPRVSAVIDWEMATVGDPRADLGYLLSFWPEEGREFPLGALIAHGPGFPTRAELVDRWATATGRDPGDTRWFVTLAVWKLAILLEASYHRWLAGLAADPFFATLDNGVPALLARAREVSGA